MGLKSAWGRGELIALGYEVSRNLHPAGTPLTSVYPTLTCFFMIQGTFKRIRETYVLPNVHYYYNTITRLKGTFHYTHGNGDQESVLLHPVGWVELVQNLESIEVEFGYTDGYAIWDPLRLPKLDSVRT